MPFPAVAAGFASAETLGETVTEGALAMAPETERQANVPPPTAESLRQTICSALSEGGHSSAAQLLGSGTWTLEATSLRIDVAAMGKKMLSLTVNAAAEKIIRQELQRVGAPTRFLVAPGVGMVQTDAPAVAAPSGSIEKTAMSNLLVQRAKEIFKAEIRSVVDLRSK